MERRAIRYPHRTGHVYTVRGFPRVLDHLGKDKPLTDAQRRNLRDLYFGLGVFRTFLDDEGYYRRSRGLWRVGRLCHYAYRLSSLIRLVERSGIFHRVYDSNHRLVAFRSEATRRVMGGQRTMFN